MATTREKPPLVHRQTAEMHPFKDHTNGDQNDQEQKQTSVNPALTNTFHKYEKCTRLLQDSSKQNVESFDFMNRMLKSHIAYSFEEFTNEDDRRALGNRLVAISFVPKVIDYYNHVLDELGITAVTLVVRTGLSPEVKEQSEVIYTIREILWNFSDSSNAFSQAIVETTLVEKLASDLDTIAEYEFKDLETADMVFPFSSAVGILHNCSRNPYVDKAVFRDIGIFGTLLPFLKSKNMYVKMITMLAIGNVIKEQEIQTLDADNNIFDFIMNAMRQASLSKHRKQYGFHLAELCDGLATFAKSDHNKQVVMEKEPLRLIRDLLKGHTIAEILAAIKLVWELSFLESNKIIISREREIMMAIDSLRRNKNEGVSLAAKKAWFVLTGKDERIRNDEAVSGPQVIGGKHIMISYNWADKDIVNKIYEELKGRGYHVWIDTAETSKYDNILEGMAYGVDNAYVVLVCYSEKYKNSQNCRTEASYIFAKRKEIIPLKLQRGYNQDGWLGAMIGARIYVEFSPQKPFDKQIQATIQQIEKYKIPEKDPERSSFKPEIPRDSVDVSLSVRHHAQSGPVKPRPHTAIRKNIREWKKDDIERWAKENKIEGYAYKRVTMLTGEQLYFIYTTLVKSPDTFYSWAETKLRLGSIEDLMRFHDALLCLVTNV